MKGKEGLRPESAGTEPEARAYEALQKDRERKVLEGFSDSEKAEILRKQRTLSSLAYFIGKDFRIPVELNEPGAGWHWDFKDNIIRIDPKDLLEKSMDYLRFVISHEGGHRRMSRVDSIPLEEWRQPGFSFMMNVIEDPRDNNFVAESYPRFREQMTIAYREDLDIEGKMKEKAAKKLGHQPRFMQAGFEYIKQWFRETQGEEPELSEDLPDDVREVIEATLESARDSWWRYPSREEADESEELIRAYARKSYEINRDKIWPAFKKLVEADMEDQKTQELLDELDKEQGRGEDGGHGLPKELKDKLTPEEQKELEDAIDKAIEDAKKAQEEAGEGEDAPGGAEGGGGVPEGEDDGSDKGESGAPEAGEDGEGGEPGRPIDLDSLSDELKRKLKDYIDALPEDKKKKLAEKAKASLKEFEDDINEELRGKLVESPEDKAEDEDGDETDDEDEGDEDHSPVIPEREMTDDEREGLKKYRERIAEMLKGDANAYERARREVLPVIDKLENDLREIFVARKAKGWKSGFKRGKRIDIKKRMQEKAKSVPVVESKAWQKRELPKEKDYAITLLVDLSGSMKGENIEETFKAVVALTEVLNRLSINLEVLGFNNHILEYQKYGERISKEKRAAMGGMLSEVYSQAANWNDDGWALERASERLEKQKASQKFLIVLSDGLPAESHEHSLGRYELHGVIENILKNSDQKLIGLGLGTDTGHVEDYYPSSIANVRTDEMAEKLAGLIKDVIANYDRF